MADDHPVALRPESWAGAAARAVEDRNERNALISNVLKEGVDYGTIPGIEKPCLFKSGAEKVCDALNLYADYEVVKELEDWENRIWFYRYRCLLKQRGTEVVIATGIGSCNSRESKYGFRWVPLAGVPGGATVGLPTKSGRACEFEFAIYKAETSGKYGKPTTYWQRFKEAIADGSARRVERETKGGKKLPAWEIGETLYRIPNDEVENQVNTVDKMAQKRSLTSAVLNLGFSEKYTQDMEETDPPHYHADTSAKEPEPPQGFGMNEPGSGTVISGSVGGGVRSGEPAKITVNDAQELSNEFGKVLGHRPGNDDWQKLFDYYQIRKLGEMEAGTLTDAKIRIKAGTFGKSQSVAEHMAATETMQLLADWREFLETKPTPEKVIENLPSIDHGQPAEIPLIRALVDTYMAGHGYKRNNGLDKYDKT